MRFKPDNPSTNPKATPPRTPVRGGRVKETMQLFVRSSIILAFGLLANVHAQQAVNPFTYLGRVTDATHAAFDELDATRLVGRSAWNTKWLLIIPAGGLGANREEALSAFIRGWDANRDGRLDVLPVRDILLGLRTYSRSGN